MPGTPVPRYFFEFHADAYGDARQGSGFRAGYDFEAIGGAVDYEFVLYTGSTGAEIVSLEPGPRGVAACEFRLRHHRRGKPLPHGGGVRRDHAHEVGGNHGAIYHQTGAGAGLDFPRFRLPPRRPGSLESRSMLSRRVSIRPWRRGGRREDALEVVPDEGVRLGAAPFQSSMRSRRSGLHRLGPRLPIHGQVPWDRLRVPSLGYFYLPQDGRKCRRGRQELPGTRDHCSIRLRSNLKRTLAQVACLEGVKFSGQGTPKLRAVGVNRLVCSTGSVSSALAKSR